VLKLGKVYRVNRINLIWGVRVLLKCLLEICLVGFVDALLYVPLGGFLPSQSLDVVLKLMKRTHTVACVSTYSVASVSTHTVAFVSTHTVASVSACCIAVNILMAVFQLILGFPVATSVFLLHFFHERSFGDKCTGLLLV